VKRNLFKNVALSALLLFPALSAFASEKLIALTFDDGPRPYVLFGVKGPQPTTGLLDVLDKQNVKATFFVMGWRLAPKIWGEGRYETNIGVTCLDAAHQVLQRGHEIENHTFSHAELRSMERKKGLQWVVTDVQKGADAIKAVTGSEPKYLRPPMWVLPDDARHEIEKRGFKVLTISSQNPVAMRDINSADYLCAGKNPTQCPKPSLTEFVIKQIEQRERHGVTTHVLAFHELNTTTAVMPELITALKQRGYRFVTLEQYMKLVPTNAVASK
jgi:peptidoglycan/xylan/chitin deacetylase (PgdA/CDA1 family)